MNIFSTEKYSPRRVQMCVKPIISIQSPFKLASDIQNTLPAHYKLIKYYRWECSVKWNGVLRPQKVKVGIEWPPHNDHENLSDTPLIPYIIILFYFTRHVLSVTSFVYDTHFWLVFQQFELDLSQILCVLYMNGPVTCVKIWWRLDNYFL